MCRRWKVWNITNENPGCLRIRIPLMQAAVPESFVESRSFIVCKACAAFNLASEKTCHRCEAPLTNNHRRFDRVDVDIAGVASLPSGGKHAVQIMNISLGGLLFRSPRPYQVDDLLRLELALEDDCFNVEAEVRHVSEDYEGYSIGVEFASTSPPFIFKVHALLKDSSAG